MTNDKLREALPSTDAVRLAAKRFERWLGQMGYDLPDARTLIAAALAAPVEAEPVALCQHEWFVQNGAARSNIARQLFAFVLTPIQPSRGRTRKMRPTIPVPTVEAGTTSSA